MKKDIEMDKEEEEEIYMEDQAFHQLKDIMNRTVDQRVINYRVFGTINDMTPSDYYAQFDHLNFSFQEESTDEEEENAAEPDPNQRTKKVISTPPHLFTN